MWVIEHNVFPTDEEQRLAVALSDFRIPCERLSGADIRTRLPVPDRHTVLRGSCWLFQQLQSHAAWRADLWGTERDFDYSHYAKRYADATLNYPFTPVTFHELCWKRDTFLPNSASTVFIRPETGLKSIDGQLVSRANFDTWVEKCRMLQLRGSAQLVVAEPRVITAEYRCIIVDHALISSSQYRPIYSTGCPQAVAEFVQHIVGTIPPPCRAYVIDVAVTPDGPRVIEIGCACCVAFYESDALAIAAHFSAIAAG